MAARDMIGPEVREMMRRNFELNADLHDRLAGSAKTSDVELIYRAGAATFRRLAAGIEARGKE